MPAWRCPRTCRTGSRPSRNRASALDRLPLLPTVEQQALHQLNATQVDFEATHSVDQAIVAQLGRTPDQLAVTTGPEGLSCRELDEQSTALAHRLVARGVKPGDIVGLCLPRTPQLVVAVLGVMKAGAAYLPLDPDYPRDRLQFMVEDSRAPVVLVDVPRTADALELDAAHLHARRRAARRRDRRASCPRPMRAARPT